MLGRPYIWLARMLDLKSIQVGHFFTLLTRLLTYKLIEYFMLYKGKLETRDIASNFLAH